MKYIQYVYLSCVLFLAKVCSKKVTVEDIVRTDVSPDEAEEVGLSAKDFENAKHLKEIDLQSLGIGDGTDPTLGKYREGDILISPKIQINDKDGVARNGVRNTRDLWPNGIVPYTISSQYGDYSRAVIANVITQYHEKTCIQFKERNGEQNYVRIFPDRGCYSLVGRDGRGQQPLSLGSGCVQTGTIIHELMHVVGFYHEQSRNDRDDWITIHWDNIARGLESQFTKESLNSITHLGEQYDYASIMHYGPTAFTRNGDVTISAKKSGGHRMGQRSGFSETDLAKINKLYSCSDSGSTGGTGQTTTTTTPTTTTTTTPSPSTSCSDSSWRCRWVVRWNSAACDTSADFRRICASSCDACGEEGTVTTTTTTTGQPPESTCTDLNSSCPRWADSGYCTSRRRRTRRYMRRNCPESCGRCD